jgi:hypothetical protein
MDPYKTAIVLIEYQNDFVSEWGIMTQTTSPLRALLNVEASASVPQLSNAQMLDAPENGAIRDIWLLPPDNPKLHAGRRVAVIATDGVEGIELNTSCIISGHAVRRLT